MTPLIDTIERAFIEACDDSEIHGGAIACSRVVEAIEIACKSGEDRRGWLEGIVDAAYEQARLTYGQEWPNASGDVAELILQGLADWIALTL